MYIKDIKIVDSFHITGRGQAFVTDLDYDEHNCDFCKDDTFVYEGKKYDILSVVACLKAYKNSHKDFITFIARESMKKAAQVVLINEEGLILSVSRKTDHNDFGLPGGKQDPEDVNEMAAAIRETKEETGLDIYDLQLIFAMHKSGYMGHTYLAKYSGEINHNEPHVVKWLPFSHIINGSFGKFNQLVADSLDDLGIEYKK